MLKYAPKESHIRTHTHVRIKLYEREISKKPPQKKKKQRKSSHLLSSVAFEKKDENNNGSRNIALILKTLYFDNAQHIYTHVNKNGLHLIRFGFDPAQQSRRRAQSGVAQVVVRRQGKRDAFLLECRFFFVCVFFFVPHDDV